jgi:hypothetical protein
MAHNLSEDYVGRVPEPALVRGALVAVTAVVAVVVGKNVDVTWIDTATQIYAAASALVASILIRPKVTPTEVVDQKVNAAVIIARESGKAE